MAGRMAFLKDNKDWEATAKVASLKVAVVEASPLVTVQKKSGGPVSFLAGGTAKVAGVVEGGVKASVDARGSCEAGAMGAVHLGPWEGTIVGSIKSSGEWEVLGQGQMSPVGFLGENVEVAVKRGGRWKKLRVFRLADQRAELNVDKKY